MNKVQKALVKLLGLGSIVQANGSGGYTTGPTYEVVNGNLTTSSDNKTTYLKKGYQGNDLIYSIINLVCEKVRVCPWAVYRVEDESSLKKYLAIISKKDFSGDDFKRAMIFREKALTPYVGDGRLNELLKYPNEYCTFPNLVADSAVFKMACGGRMIWADQLGAGANADFPLSLDHLPYDLMSIVASRDFPIREIGYKLDAWGIKEIPKKSVMHDKYFNPVFDQSGSHLFGQSPLKAALLLMDASNEANRTMLSQFQNQGPKGVIFTDSDKFDITEQGQQAAAIKKILQGKEYTGSENTNKIASSGIKMGYVKIGDSLVDMGIVNLTEQQLRRFCNIFGAVPSQVLNDPANKTYNNTVEGERALTTRGALPIINSFRDSFNMKLGTDWGYKGKNIFVDADLTVYSELQDSMKDKWAWVKELPVSWKYKLEMMGLDYGEGEPGLDEVMIPSGFQPIDSLNIVDETLNNDTEGNPTGGL